MNNPRIGGHQVTGWFGYYGAAPSIMLLGCLLAFVSLPLFRGADVPPNPKPHRDVAIDGLRGFLAIAVVLHHLEMAVHSGLTGKGGLPPSTYYTILGQAGVAIFFMITGYLFWGKMLAVEGRPAWGALFVGRLFRLLPLYYVLIASAVLIACIETGWSRGAEPIRILKTLVKLGAGGLFGISEFNGYTGFSGLIGPTWTLRYEWLFYASLIVMGPVCRWRPVGLVLPPALMLALSVHTFMTVPAMDGPPAAICTLQFLIGMTVASLRSALPGWRLPDTIGSPVMAATLILMFMLFSNGVQTVPVLWLGLFFGLAATGHTLFGLLQSRPARRLGDVSYGIYLLQGPVAWLCGQISPFSVLSPLTHWLSALMMLAILVTVATVTHVLVERPGIDAGRRMIRWVERRAAARPLSQAAPACTN